jgi:DNA recombination protein RmuC
VDYNLLAAELFRRMNPILRSNMNIVTLNLITCGSLLITLVFCSWRILKKYNQNQASLVTIQKLSEQFLVRLEERDKNIYALRDHLLKLLSQHQKEQAELRTQFDTHQFKTLRSLQESLQLGMMDMRKQISESLAHHAELINQKMDKLTQETGNRLKDISLQVDKRLTDGFEKTTATFTDIIKRLALIDEAQKKITELSMNVVNLQEVLADKRSRGAFGEVQLNHLIRNVLPEETFQLQFTLSNDKRADAILFLPDPTGNIVIDAKFPLESYRRYTDINLSEQERKSAEQQFRIDVKKHIQAIRDKYIIEGETADGAMMFIPAEAIFSDIHAKYPELIEFGHSLRVWLVSPTTLMAILNTARAVLKDAATRKQVHIIQEHLSLLGKDFIRFQKRIDNLAKHIEQAHHDVEDVHKSSKKLTSRFIKIEKVELDKDLKLELLVEEEAD